MGTEKKELLLGAWKLGKAYWVSSEKWRARGLLAVTIGLNLGIVYINVLLNYWRNTFYNVLSERDYASFWPAIGQFSLLAGLFILVAGYQIYCRMLLSLHWRKWLTAHYVKEWLNKQTYYRMKLLDSNSTDNPDQRISEDINLFVTHTLTLSLGLLRETVSLISFVIILWQLSGAIPVTIGDTVFMVSGYLVWSAIAYAVVGTLLTFKLGRPLVSLNFLQQRYEADFRFSLMRLRENGESVALYKGEEQENQNFIGRFQRVFDNYRKLMKLNKQLTWLTSGYSQIAIIAGVLVASPRYFANEISLGEMFQISGAFQNVQDALSFFVDSFTTLAEWKAVVNRLSQFTDNMEKVETAEKLTSQIGQGREVRSDAALTGISVCRPDGYELLTELTLQIASGERLLVTGPSGCGKSTLLRTLAGIWPFGKGNIVMPEGKKLLFLPQKSYFPLGTLREALYYPGMPSEPGEEDVLAALKLCRMDSLCDRLEDTEDWAQVLSLGEQQRLAFARVLLQKPDMVFLDEATSAVDETTETALYQSLIEALPHATIISVGHRSTLLRYHSKKLCLAGQNGGWQVEKIAI